MRNHAVFATVAIRTRSGVRRSMIFGKSTKSIRPLGAISNRALNACAIFVCATSVGASFPFSICMSADREIPVAAASACTLIRRCSRAIATAPPKSTSGAISSKRARDSGSANSSARKSSRSLVLFTLYRLPFLKSSLCEINIVAVRLLLLFHDRMNVDNHATHDTKIEAIFDSIILRPQLPYLAREFPNV